MAYFRTLHPEEMIWGDVGEKALGSRGALTCGAAQNARLDSRQRDRHIAVPSKTERRESGLEPLCSAAPHAKRLGLYGRL
jgi:hypothetical protein